MVSFFNALTGRHMLQFWQAPTNLKNKLSVAILLSLTSGCYTPIGAERASTAQVYHQLKIAQPASTIRSDSLAASVLRRYKLEDHFRRAPQETLQILHEKALSEPGRNLLLGLAELNYIEGERIRHKVKHRIPDHAHDYFLASAIYAWFFLFAETGEAPPLPVEPRFRNACVLYNCALFHSLSTNSIDLVASLGSGPRNLAFGKIDLSVDTNAISGIPAGIHELLFADRFLVRGLERYRQHGLGVPLIPVSQISTNNPVPVSM